jgi:hypothetical protein
MSKRRDGNFNYGRPMKSITASNSARSLCDVADSLKQVKDAYRTFLTLWAAEMLADDASAMESLIRDLDQELENNQRSVLYQPRPLDD